MELKLYGFDDIRVAFPWDDFVSGFPPKTLAQQSPRESDWRVEHPTCPIHFFAKRWNPRPDSIWAVNFDFYDLVRLGKDASCAGHPVWSGVFHALVSWPAIVAMQPAGLGEPVAEAIIIARPELVPRLPTWAQKCDTKFVVSERAEFDRLIAEAFALSLAVRSGAQSRDGWADEIEQDEEARQAFAGYVFGKRGKLATYTWGGRRIRPPHGMKGSFLDRYADGVDWRATDDSIVEYVGKRLKRPRLGVKMLGEDLLISFGSSQRMLTCQEIGTERYHTIRAVNEIMAPDFQIRLVEDSVNTDTHDFLLAPAWLWKYLEDLDRAKLERKIKVIGPGDGFH